MDDLDLIDVRLLRLFEAIHATRHLTRAGEQLGLSQPTVSIGLARLRRHFSDPLFVRTSEGMQPTPQADVMVEQVRDILEALRRLSHAEAAFVPERADRLFRICMTDASHIALLPRLMAQIHLAAPEVRLEALRIDDGIAHALQSGGADLALGYIPALDAGFYQQTLYMQDWVCLTGRDHPRVGAVLTLERYQGEAHVRIVSGTGQHLLDQALRQYGIERQIRLSLPGILGLSAILGGSDLIATLPRMIGEALARLGGLSIHECPFPIPAFPVKQHWHARYHHDPANRWLRGIAAQALTPPSRASSRSR